MNRRIGYALIAVACVGMQNTTSTATMSWPDISATLHFDKLTNVNVLLAFANCALAMGSNASKETNKWLFIATDLVRLAKDLRNETPVSIPVFLDLMNLCTHLKNKKEEHPERNQLTLAAYAILLPVVELMLDLDHIVGQDQYTGNLATIIQYDHTQTPEEAAANLHRNLHILSRLAEACIQTKYHKLAVAWFLLHTYSLFRRTAHGQTLRDNIYQQLAHVGLIGGSKIT